MINQAEVDRLYDCDVLDAHGERIGSVKQVWLDDRDGRPMWASVHTGLLGMKESFVPIQDATIDQGHILVPVEKQQVKDAPRIDTEDQHMSDEQQERLYRHYGMIPGVRSGDHDKLQGKHATRGRESMAGKLTDERAARDRGDSVTRYEEQLDVGTRDVEAGRVRLVKHTVTEQKDVSVPVTHEEVRVVREPADGPDGSRPFADEEAEVTLRRQEPVVDKHAEAVERVRLEKEAVTEQQKVRGEVRKEEVDVQHPQGRVPRDPRNPGNR
ncbi:DUF2382 domain-containing protein [Saccharothrix variisporea]|uniref:Uncharacterized protein (TIGR02271 family) n=1 Tax=Saccharothrix variisporea TaxID=543527 RepID=A0A495XFM5_9PSEU|nr:PRC and DUF2382 domain-containing protein [Saccharothrix variisporea]RKT73251.1 uncharacterized protein (TIGR02271 family) [Saccharothrix variisporea]